MVNSPNRAPNKKYEILTTSRLLTASITKGQLPNNTKIKLPEIPGTTNAEIAINPDMNI